ncbi:MAG: hypothetical protein NTZ60_02635 [Campylobacterales bacterium]|nr:hypothetical protein [Campylobacterales bacterium]
MWSVATILASALGFISKNPIVAKMLIFTTFIAIISYSLSFIKELVAPFLVSNAIMGFAGYFGFFDGLSIYLTIIVAGFGVKQVLAFIRS